MRIAFLGLGQMGTAIAHLLQTSGYELAVWNRTPAATQPFAAAGATVGSTPADAAKDARIVFTMLADDAAITSVVFGEEARPGVLEAMEEGAIHISLSTISVALSQRLTEAHQQRQQHFVAAPVFGRPHIAEQGKLWIAAAGAHAALDSARPVLERISRGLTIVAEEPWRANALKLGGNFLIASMIQALGEAFVFAEGAGLDPEVFLETINNALFQSAFYTQYGKTMLNPPSRPGATVALGRKDLALFQEAAKEVSRQLPLADYIAQQLNKAGDQGMNDEDWSVGQYRMAQAAQKDQTGARR